MVPVWVWNPAPTVFHRSFPHQDDVEAKKRMFTHTYTQASYIPSGKRLHSYGKSPFFNGKINYLNGNFQ